MAKRIKAKALEELALKAARLGDGVKNLLEDAK